ncbi:MAG: hypothetical protein D6683_07110 [Actinomyces sp.]|nr:MAG: hypothetical protein D6683_07110 [Actinomyces sp.]
MDRHRRPHHSGPVPPVPPDPPVPPRPPVPPVPPVPPDSPPAPTSPVALRVLEIADDPDAWRAAGFTVGSGPPPRVRLGGVEVVLTGSGGRPADERGVTGVGITGIDADLDGLPRCDHAPASPGPDHAGHERPDAGHAVRHPNGVRRLDHIVLVTPDCDRTTAAFVAAGLEVRRVRRIPAGDATRRQTFFWLGDVIAELVGDDSAHGAGPTRVWGLALTVADIEHTAAVLGDALGPVRPAVQPGRRIATLRTRELGISTAIAVMSPHRPGGAGPVGGQDPGAGGAGPADGQEGGAGGAGR